MKESRPRRLPSRAVGAIALTFATGGLVTATALPGPAAAASKGPVQVSG